MPLLLITQTANGLTVDTVGRFFYIFLLVMMKTIHGDLLVTYKSFSIQMRHQQ